MDEDLEAGRVPGELEQPHDADDAEELENVVLLQQQQPATTSTSVSYIYFASAVDCSHMTASSSASWSRFSPASNFLNGHVSMWFMVCRWPQSQEVGWARPHLCKLT